RLEKAIGRGIAIESRHDVGAKRETDRWIALERVAIGLPDQLRRDVGMVEPLGHTMHDGSFERVMMQNGRIDEGCELSLAADHFLGLATDARPNRIDLAEGICRFCLLSGHHDSPDVILTTKTILAQRPWS